MTTNDKLLTSIVGGDLIFVLTVFAVPWGNLKQEAETFSGGDLSWQLLQSKMKVISKMMAWETVRHRVHNFVSLY